MEQIGKKAIRLTLLNYLPPVFLNVFLILTSHVNIFHDFSFLDDIEVMLKWRPPVVYKYLWKYVCLIAMVGLLAASFMRMIFKRPTYTAWNQATVRYFTSFSST